MKKFIFSTLISALTLATLAGPLYANSNPPANVEKPIEKTTMTLLCDQENRESLTAQQSLIAKLKKACTPSERSQLKFSDKEQEFLKLLMQQHAVRNLESNFRIATMNYIPVFSQKINKALSGGLSYMDYVALEPFSYLLDPQVRKEDKDQYLKNYYQSFNTYAGDKPLYSFMLSERSIQNFEAENIPALVLADSKAKAFVFVNQITTKVEKGEEGEEGEKGEQGEQGEQNKRVLKQEDGESCPNSVEKKGPNSLSKESKDQQDYKLSFSDFDIANYPSLMKKDDKILLAPNKAIQLMLIDYRGITKQSDFEITIFNNSEQAQEFLPSAIEYLNLSLARAEFEVARIQQIEAQRANEKEELEKQQNINIAGATIKAGGGISISGGSVSISGGSINAGAIKISGNNVNITNSNLTAEETIKLEANKELTSKQSTYQGKLLDVKAPKINDDGSLAKAQEELKANNQAPVKAICPPHPQENNEDIFNKGDLTNFSYSTILGVNQYLVNALKAEDNNPHYQSKALLPLSFASEFQALAQEKGQGKTLSKEDFDSIAKKVLIEKLGITSGYLIDNLDYFLLEQYPLYLSLTGLEAK